MRTKFCRLVQMMLMIGLIGLTGCAFTEHVSIQLPADIEAYRQASALSVQGGEVLNLNDITLVKTMVSVSKKDHYKEIIEATTAPLLNQSQRGKVHYFALLDGVAYVVLEMDEDAWAGVSAAIAATRPLITLNLLSLDEIDEVKFEYPKWLLK